MNSRTYPPDRHEDSENFGIVKFFSMAAAMTAGLFLLTWLVASSAGWNTRFAEYRITVFLAALLASLLTSSVIFDRLYRRQHPSEF